MTAGQANSVALLLCGLFVWQQQLSHAFSFSRRRAFLVSKSRLASSVGGGPPPSDDGNKKSDGSWDDFFREEESENMMRAREYLNENALPINFDAAEDSSGEGKETSESSAESKKDVGAQDDDAAALMRTDGPQLFGDDGPTEDVLLSNPYMAVVSNISPSDLISKFTSTAHPRVQNAVRSTILSLIGGLPKMAFDTTTITTGQRLASLMFQLQMTGYMFKNAEYRLSLQQSLGSISEIMDGNKFLLEGSQGEDGEEKLPLEGKVKGKLRVRYGVTGDESDDDDQDESSESSSDESSPTPEPSKAGGGGGLEMEVDAAAYMSELRSEVLQLRDELVTTRKAKEDALRKDLLVYIRTLPEQELRSLTGTISQDVLVAMKGLVNAVMSGIGEGQIGPDTVTEQSGEAMAQLCMWQLVVGYNLRTLEVREEMKKSLGEKAAAEASAESSSSSDGDAEPPTDDTTSSSPGAFE